VIRTATRDDLPSLRSLFARANDAPYALETVAEEKCFGAGIAGEPLVRVFGDFDGAAVTCGKWLRILVVDRNERGRGIGSALIADSKATVAFAEPGNYFTPGVLATDQATLAFFRARGFAEKWRTWTLHVELKDIRGANCEVREPGDEEVLDFIEREFGRIWRFESSRARGIVVKREDGAITGFAAYEANNRGLGVFGPTGVPKSMRGRGIGRDVLLGALDQLRKLGYGRAIIPWTDALEFYRKSCGAERAHEFVGLDSAP
jgi:GNAT superfamily N-acetyltransferase